MKPSARSIRTGPYSRGGHGHTTRQRLAVDPGYYRRWRASHPDYVARDNERRREARHEAQLIADRAWVDELLAA